jgi:rRNA-processing protein FCF1
VENVADKVRILLDTNFLLTMVRHRIHGFEEMKEKGKAEFYTLSAVIGEMESLGRSDKKIRRETDLVKQILKNNDVKVLESYMPNVDNEMVERSKEYVIATNDKALREKIKSFGGKTVYIRSLTYIETSEVFDE